MELSGFVDIGLALVTVYLLLSLLASTINEIINTIRKTRANNLAATIQSILESDDLKEKFFTHGLIGGMGRSSNAGSERKPNALPPMPSYLDSKTFADALMGVLVNGDPSKPVKVPVLADIKSSVEALSPGATRDAMLAALAVANDDITRFRDGVASWFDASMDRLSGAFVRQMKVISFVVGLVLAGVLNVDSINVAYRTWGDPHVRAAVAQAADTLQKSPPAQCKGEEIADEINCEIGKAGNLINLLRPLPVGWGASSIPSFDGATILGEDGKPKLDEHGQPKKEFLYWSFIAWVGLKIVGILVTGFAVSLGAPFWFDILQKVMSFRAAGTKPQESPAPN